jgi:hypothetical protein
MDEDLHSEQGFDADSAMDFLNWPEYGFYQGFLQLSNDSKRG